MTAGATGEETGRAEVACPGTTSVRGASRMVRAGSVSAGWFPAGPVRGPAPGHSQLHGTEYERRDQADDQQSDEHRDRHRHPGRFRDRAMSPKTHRRKTVTVKWRASVRLSGSLKASGS